MMNSSPENILLVENDPDISDFILHQVLEPMGYKAHLVGDVNAAIQYAARNAPDLIIADLDLPGLSGKDLLVALNSHGLQMPVIVIAEKGQENNVIQAFRLGGTDYLLWPGREAEVASSVERAIKHVREGHERQALTLQLKQTNEELQRRIRELTTIFAVGKAVVSITDQHALFEKIVDGTLSIAEADYGWLLVREDQNRAFVLAAQRNLPDSWAKKMGQPLNDGVSNLVALSGEPLIINGEPLRRFNVSSLGNSVAVVPLKVQWEVVGLLVAVRKSERPFDRNMQSLLEALADYASVSMVNARLFRAIQQTADSARAGERAKLEQLQALTKEIESLIQPVTYPIDLMLAGKMGKLNNEQKQALASVQMALFQTLQTIREGRPSTQKAPTGSNKD